MEVAKRDQILRVRFFKLSPCIMCVQYRGGAQYCGGHSEMFSTVGDITINVGRYHEYCEGVQYHGDTRITKDLSPHGTEHLRRYS